MYCFSPTHSQMQSLSDNGTRGAVVVFRDKLGSPTIVADGLSLRPFSIIFFCPVTIFGVHLLHYCPCYPRQFSKYEFCVFLHVETVRRSGHSFSKIIPGSHVCPARSITLTTVGADGGNDSRVTSCVPLARTSQTRLAKADWET